MGRPKKEGAMKAGEISDDLCRFTFIANKNKVDAIKKRAAQNSMSVKDFMDILLSNELETNVSEGKEPGIRNKKKPARKNEEKLKQYLKKRISDSRPTIRPTD